MRDRLFIDGKWQAPAKGGTFPVIDPATEEVVHRAPAGTKEDIDAAVKAARLAFDQGPWPRLSGKERGAVLRRISEIILARKHDLARLEVIDNGKPMPEAVWDMEDTAGCFAFYAGLAEEMDDNPEEAITLAEPRFSSKVVREPIGVAGAIIPWNYPLLMASWKVAPALAAGCTMVLKPSELTPLTALELGAIVEEAGLPAGVLNIVTGLGADAGQPLSEHPGVDKLAFTGSVPTGAKIMAAAARDIKNVSLELGGKSPFVVFADSDIEKAVEWIMFGIFWNQGQVCSATSRVLVEDSLYPALMERLVAESAKIRIGNGLEDGTLLGPLVSKGQYDKVLAAIERGKAEGAVVAGGGKRPAGLDKGYFLEPTILTDMAEDSFVWTEEIFGPVVCVRPFRDEADAIRMANDSRFGLAAAVMSKDKARCERVARAFRAGIVWINCSQPTFTEAPWGGYKQSGIGRELGRWGLSNYLETKQITSFNSEEPWGWYIKPA
ncbi:aldehyde dehydrogenase family protein [Rhizobium sp. S95]|uniref:Aldehyde dehydrogenase family protein n=1 Tax=Ciceribacter sichuanensis TaxID=2949647 RepID=A0AAJ1BZN9_9HYPH|nr:MULTISPECIES: aldehyde dehydrogenase family protein [unclassified Ciceribacter]MCM2397211.1 aldehyde dehydrogenase family protein [Ciceribacter sp. S95]MCO5959139.1 aldehyde dehydrogenase family protein [Ciceribacter sp. S101]